MQNDQRCKTKGIPSSSKSEQLKPQKMSCNQYGKLTRCTNEEGFIGEVKHTYRKKKDETYPSVSRVNSNSEGPYTSLRCTVQLKHLLLCKKCVQIYPFSFHMRSQLPLKNPSSFSRSDSLRYCFFGKPSGASYVRE